MPLLLLFISGFVSATLLPGSSEAGLLATLHLEIYAPIWVIIVATLGNTLGGMTNYWLGLFIPNRLNQEKHRQQAVHLVQRFGYGSLLFSWLPIIGDPLCLVAGWLRMRQLPCLLLIALGKAIRYAVLTALFYQII